jgi:hypothetical protein
VLHLVLQVYDLSLTHL